MPEIRVYFIIRAQTASAPTENQWRNVLQDAAQQPGTLARAIVGYARDRRSDRPHNRLSGDKRSQNPAQLRRYTLASFELDRDDADEALALLDSVAAARGVSGTTRQKFEGVLQAEMREAAQRQGFTLAQANQISVQVVAIGARDAAKADVRAYLAANALVWAGGG